MGLILPVVLIFVLRQDLFARFWPEWHRSALAEPLELAGLACLILLARRCSSAWRGRRDRCRTDRSAPAGAGGPPGRAFASPTFWSGTPDTSWSMPASRASCRWFRYVLLTDALIETSSPAEVAAVFGHEVGHVAHRHLPFFGFFFLGSLGVMSLTAQVFSISEGWIEGIPWIPASQARSG